MLKQTIHLQAAKISNIAIRLIALVEEEGTNRHNKINYCYKTIRTTASECFEAM